MMDFNSFEQNTQGGNDKMKESLQLMDKSLDELIVYLAENYNNDKSDDSSAVINVYFVEWENKIRGKNKIFNATRLFRCKTKIY